MKILIMGLPGSGKTWLGERISKHFSIPFWDADDVRRIYNDWDFSIGGRALQTERMRTLAEIDDISISAYVCPLPALRHNFNPDKLIWMDTIEEGRYEDTNKLFHPPLKIYDLRITKWIDENRLFRCLDDINHGIKDTQNFSNELIEKLDKLQ
jgi:adenylylsulfate kinase